MTKLTAKSNSNRKAYETPKLDKESFFEETGLFGSGCCSSPCNTHWCQTSGYCSNYGGNSCS